MVTSNRLPSTKSFTLYLTIKDDNKSKIFTESLQYCCTKDTDFLKACTDRQSQFQWSYPGVLIKIAKFEYTREFPWSYTLKVIWYLQKLIDPLNTENLLCPKAVANQRLSPWYLVHLCPQFIIRAVQSQLNLKRSVQERDLDTAGDVSTGGRHNTQGPVRHAGQRGLYTGRAVCR